MDYLKNRYKGIKHVIVIPIISTLIIPIIIMDIWSEIYHRICFPLYKLNYLKRSNYIRIDRHKLKYLTFWQKLYCIYCGYGNGAIRYWAEMQAKTEKYWCGIKNKKQKGFIEPEHHKRLKFSEYNNEKEFRSRYKP